MIVTVHPLDGKSMLIFKDLLNQHQIPHMAIQDGLKPVYQVPNSKSHLIGHRDFLPFVADVDRKSVV